MGVGPPPRERSRNFWHTFFLVKLFFKEIGAEGAEEKNFKISDLSNSNSNRTKSLAAVEKISKILEFFSAAVKGFYFFCRRKSKKKSLAAVEKISKILEFFSAAVKGFRFFCRSF